MSILTKKDMKQFTLCHTDEPFSRRWVCEYGMTEDQLKDRKNEIRANHEYSLCHTFDFNQYESINDQKYIYQDRLKKEYLPYVIMTKGNK